jgi:hypothetical protein
MKRTLSTLHRVRETRRVAALARAMRQDSVVAQAEKGSTQAEAERRRRVALREQSLSLLAERLRAGAQIEQVQQSAVHGQLLQHAVKVADDEAVAAKKLVLEEEAKARELHFRLRRADAETRKVGLAQERFAREARRYLELREEDQIEDVSRRSRSRFVLEDTTAASGAGNGDERQ